MNECQNASLSGRNPGACALSSAKRRVRACFNHPCSGPCSLAGCLASGTERLGTLRQDPDSEPGRPGQPEVTSVGLVLAVPAGAIMNTVGIPLG